MIWLTAIGFFAVGFLYGLIWGLLHGRDVMYDHGDRMYDLGKRHGKEEQEGFAPSPGRSKR